MTVPEIRFIGDTTDAYIEILWKRLSSAANIENLNHVDAATIGSVFYEMKYEIIRLRKIEAGMWKLNNTHVASTNKLHNRAQIAENLLERARREIAALKLQNRPKQRQSQYVKDGLKKLREDKEKGTCELCNARNVLVKVSESHMAIVCMECIRH